MDGVICLSILLEGGVTSYMSAKFYDFYDFKTYSLVETKTKSVFFLIIENEIALLVFCV